MNAVDEEQLCLDALLKRAAKPECSEDCCRSNSLTSLHLPHGCHSALTTHRLVMPPWLSGDPAITTYSQGDQLIPNRSRHLLYPPVSLYQDSGLPLPVSLSVPLALPFVAPSAASAASAGASTLGASGVGAAIAASRRSRGEKKPTPEDQKDQRYLERRRRNNTAAKKSRDARRAREDQIALRACILEHENAVLRAQLIAVKNESEALRTLFLSRRSESSENTLSS